MYRLRYALIISSLLMASGLFVTPSFGITRTQNNYDNEGSIKNEFINFANLSQDKRWQIVTSSPTTNNGQLVIYSSGTCIQLFYGKDYYIEFKKK